MRVTFGNAIMDIVEEEMPFYTASHVTTNNTEHSSFLSCIN